MKRIIFLLGFVFSLSSIGFSQDVVVKGTVVDSKKKAIPYATIEVMDLPDSTLVNGALADEEGQFEITLYKGKFYLVASSIGFTSDKIAIDAQNSNSINLGNIELTNKVEELEGVIVQSRRSTFDLKLDKRVFNVGADLSSAAGNATEVLENIPSVTIDGEGNVSLRGSQSVRILINGRPSSLVKDGASLQNLQGNMIERVEVITNASARYEAEGDVGIINIILKKNVQLGLNGSISANTGYNPQAGIGINLNYRKNKINYFTNLSFNYRESPGTSNTYQRFSNIDTSFIYEQDYKSNRIGRRLNALVGADYFINDYHSITASFMIDKGFTDQFTDRRYADFDFSNIKTGESLRKEDLYENEISFESSLNYRRTFDRTGKEWITQLTWNYENEKENSDYNESYFINSNPAKIEKSEVTGIERNIILQSDYINPFGEEGKIEVGVRAGVRRIDNDFLFGQYLSGAWQYPSSFNDVFVYDEKVYAGYTAFSNQYNKIGVLAGLRAEYSDVSTKQNSNSANNSQRSYLNLFPSATVSYSLEDNGTLQGSYSRRIRRPGQWDLLPFTKFGDNREIRNGNAFLDPEFTDSYEISYLQNWAKGSLLGSIYHRHKTGVIERIAEIDPNGIIRIIPQNLSVENAYGLETNFNYDITKWLRMTTNFNFFRAITKGEYKGADFNADTYSWTNRSTLNLSVNKWRAQTSFNYTAPRKTTQGKNLSMYHMDLGLSRLILKGKGNIVFNVRDIFNSRKWRFIRDTEELYTKTEMQWRPRSFTLSFTFRINQRFENNKEKDILNDDGGGGEG